jgi:hypothetical protein
MAKQIKVPMIQSLIIELRGKRVILDRDLAVLYQVTTKALNQAVRRNRGRFPNDFMFQLNKEEWEYLRSQIVTANKGTKKIRTLPYVFTRNGANMVCTILKSPLAIRRAIQIMRAFTAIEEFSYRIRRGQKLNSGVLKQVKTHSRAIMHLFQRDKARGKQFNAMKGIQGKMIRMLQQIIFASFDGEKNK